MLYAENQLDPFRRFDTTPVSNRQTRGHSITRYAHAFTCVLRVLFAVDGKTFLCFYSSRVFNVFIIKMLVQM